MVMLRDIDANEWNSDAFKEVTRARQDNKCPVCDGEITQYNSTWSVQGGIDGVAYLVCLLCHQLLRENPGRMRAVANFLETRVTPEVPDGIGTWTWEKKGRSAHIGSEYHARVNGYHYVVLQAMAHPWKRPWIATERSEQVWFRIPNVRHDTPEMAMLAVEQWHNSLPNLRDAITQMEMRNAE